MEKKLTDYEKALANGVNKIIWKVRINSKKVAALEILGIKTNKRTTIQETAKVEKYANVAENFGQDAYKYDRKDAAGIQRSDSGVHVLEAKNFGSEELFQSLLDLGWKRIIEVFRKENDTPGMYYLSIAFVRECENQGTSINENKFMAFMQADVLSRTYKSNHIWNNPDGSMTFNLCHAQERNQLAKESHLKITAENDKLKLRGKW